MHDFYTYSHNPWLSYAHLINRNLKLIRLLKSGYIPIVVD